MRARRRDALGSFPGDLQKPELQGHSPGHVCPRGLVPDKRHHEWHQLTAASTQLTGGRSNWLRRTGPHEAQLPGCCWLRTADPRGGLCFHLRGTPSATVVGGRPAGRAGALGLTGVKGAYSVLGPTRPPGAPGTWLTPSRRCPLPLLVAPAVTLADTCRGSGQWAHSLSGPGDPGPQNSRQMPGVRGSGPAD